MSQSTAQQPITSKDIQFIIEQIISQSYDDVSGVLDCSSGAERIIKLMVHQKSSLLKEIREEVGKLQEFNGEYNTMIMKDDVLYILSQMEEA